MNELTGLGKKIWVIPEGYIPEYSSLKKGKHNYSDKALESHETFCVLNTNTVDAHIQLTIFFSDKDPIDTYKLVVPARRTKHFRFNDLAEPMIEEGTDFSSVIQSDVPVIVQHTRLDSRQAEISLLSTIAYPCN
ncbi:MAG TPA: sensory rhodopsin transducer [Vampirovibrionales bacterium]